MKALAKLLCVLCFMLTPSASTLAQETWSKGDSILTFFICAKEKDIMDVALADAKNIEEYSQKLLEKSITQSCFRLAPPQKFVVEEVITTYIDHQKTDTCVLKIKAKRNKDLVGYVVAAGIPGKGI